METGIRDLKNNLSQLVRRAAEGQRVSITSHGRVVAVLGPPESAAAGAGRRRGFTELVARGVIETPLGGGGAIRWPTIRLPRGVAATLIDEDREEA